MAERVAVTLTLNGRVCRFEVPPGRRLLDLVRDDAGLTGTKEGCGSGECEKAVSAQNGATIRVIPFDSPDESGVCVMDGRPSDRRVLFARAY